MKEITSLQELAELWKPVVEATDWTYHKKWVSKAELMEIKRDEEKAQEDSKEVGEE